MKIYYYIIYLNLEKLVSNYLNLYLIWGNIDLTFDSRNIVVWPFLAATKWPAQGPLMCVCVCVCLSVLSVSSSHWMPPYISVNSTWTFMKLQKSSCAINQLSQLVYLGWLPHVLKEPFWLALISLANSTLSFMKLLT